MQYFLPDFYSMKTMPNTRLQQWAFPFPELDVASEPRNWKKTICFWYPLWKHNMKFFYIQKLSLAGFLQFPAAEIGAFHTNTRLRWFPLGRTQSMSLKAQGQGWRVFKLPGSGWQVRECRENIKHTWKINNTPKGHSLSMKGFILKHCLKKQQYIIWEVTCSPSQSCVCLKKHVKVQHFN